MTLAEFQHACAIARSPVTLASSLQPFDGFGLPGFRPLACTLFDVAHLIRWQALQFNGQFDLEALDEVRTIGRHKFLIVP